MREPGFIPYQPPRLNEAEMLSQARQFYARMDQRRSVRQFSPDPVPRELIELAIATASTAPSGAHRQPWRFVVVSDPVIKHRIRIGAEAEEQRFYQGGRATAEWLEALSAIGTNWEKPYLDLAPWLVVVFAELHEVGNDGRSIQNYYVKESVGIACGMFIAAVHHMGLATLPHTPGPMHFLTEVLERPPNEKPYVLFPVGYPASDAMVPNLRRKSLSEVTALHTG
jgi:iodotyrosine deiodinase